jgi:hypothetical protein
VSLCPVPAKVWDSRYENEDGWIDITTEEDINDLSFEVRDFYVAADGSKVKEQRAIIEAELEAIIEEAKVGKAAKAKAAKDKRDKAKSEKESK